jgi:hypothetical protein
MLVKYQDRKYLQRATDRSNLRVWRHSSTLPGLVRFLWPLHPWLARNLAAGLEKELHLYIV